MATLSNFQSYKLRAFAIVTPEGQSPVTVDIQSFHIAFALNSIPYGSVNLALGRGIPYGLAATIHHYVDFLSVRVPIEIYLEVLVGSNSIGFQLDNWPSGPFLVFRGSVTRTDYRRSRDAASLNLRFNHWLGELNASSSLTRSSHTLTPQQLSGAAAMMAGAGAPVLFGNAAGGEFFTPNNIRTDMWGLAMGPWLQHLCNQNLLNDDGTLIDPNTEGLSALLQFEPFVYSGNYSSGAPLPMTAAGRAGAAFLADAVAEAVCAETFESFASSTIWDKLAGNFAGDYLFAIVPLVNTALVVPGMAGHRVPWQTIYGEEYVVTDSSGNLSRALKGVHLFSGMNSITGALGLRRAEAADEPVLAGKYEVEVDGMIVNASIPRWAANFVVPGDFADAAAPFGIRGGAIFPGVGAAAVANPAVVKEAAVPLWNEFARAVYVFEALRGRTGTIQGKLRFDIGPGSTVQIFGVEDKFVKAQLGQLPSNVMFAEVESVGISVDAENLSASTTYQLKNMRNDSENTYDFMSVSRHPLYDGLWRGCVLAEERAFLAPFGL